MRETTAEYRERTTRETLAVPCPVCHVRPGQGCVGPKGTPHRYHNRVTEHVKRYVLGYDTARGR